MKRYMSYTLPLQSRYKIEESDYTYNPMLLQMHYDSFVQMDDEEFLDNILNALHFACFMSFVMKIDHVEILSDKGVIHELVHLSKKSTKQYTDIEIVRKKFKELFAYIPDTFDINAKYPNLSGQEGT